LEYWTKAAELGDADAHAQLSSLYHYAHGVVDKDMKKSIYHAEQAAIAGHPKARYNLGVNEAKYCGRYDRAVKHFIIAASVGCQHSLKTLDDLYGEGYASKEDYDSALRAYQAAVDEMKSPEREEAEAHCKTTTEG
jgi:TPR repeat protein